MPVSILTKLFDGVVVHIPGHVWGHPVAQCHSWSAQLSLNWWEVPGSCITGIFLLSFAATEWEWFLLTYQQWGRRQRKAVRDCHTELLAWNSCIRLQAGQKLLSPKLLSHRLEFVSCPHRSQAPETAVSQTEWYQELYLSLTVCTAPLPEVLQRAYEIKTRQDCGQSKGEESWSNIKLVSVMKLTK